MGIFNFRNKDTGEEFSEQMTIAEAEAFTEANPHIDWLCGAPLIHSGRGLGKPDAGFREVLTRIKKNTDSKYFTKSKVNTF